MSEVATATIFLDGKAYDTFRAPSDSFCPFFRGHPQMGWELAFSPRYTSPHNWAYLDTSNAEIWGRVVIEPTTPHWWIVHNYRRKDLSGLSTGYITARWPGSLCDPHGEDLPAFLLYSSKALLREFQLHFQIRKESWPAHLQYQTPSPQPQAHLYLPFP